jgi:ABC-type transport system involved in multi-copper enzyme maturation permease subunit
MIARILTVAHLTVHEALRKRVLLAALTIGLAFLTLDAVGFHFILRPFHGKVGAEVMAQKRFATIFFSLAGLYAARFLVAMSAVLLPIDTLSGEIASGVVQTLATKPVSRVEIVLGKWLAYVTVVLGYLLLLGGGLIAVYAAEPHYVPPNLGIGAGLLALEATALVTLSIAGGARLSTITNGMLAFGLYGMAFIGGWIEQIATFTHNVAARNVGTVASLFMPTEAMWQLAEHHLQPPLTAQLETPFSPASVPSPAMVVWAGLWIVAVLLTALRGFARRPL